MPLSPHYQSLINAFSEWLGLMGYAESSVYGHPRSAAEFMDFLETKEIKRLQKADARVVSAFFAELQTRQNKRRGGTLSPAYLNKYLQALKLLSRYVRESGLDELTIEQSSFSSHTKEQIALSSSEIKRLYEYCGSTPAGLRDRAMLAVYYGCGLRRREGEMLDVNDVLAAQNLLYVRYGKGNRERYVPMSPGVRADLMAWLEKGRPAYDPKDDALLISVRGKRLSGQMAYLRLKALCQKASIQEIGLHGLRHSIATHLLKAGMKLEEVATFLGHSSLESTQIYTHVRNG